MLPNKTDLKKLGLSFADYNANAAGGTLWRLPYWYRSEYRQAGDPARAAAFATPIGIDGLADPTLALNAPLPGDTRDLSGDQIAKVEEILFNRLALKAFSIICDRGNPSVGEVIDAIHGDVDPATGAQLASQKALAYVASVVKSAIYSQLSFWVNANPYERTNSTSYTTGAGVGYSIDASNWVIAWDGLSTLTKEIVNRSYLYQPTSFPADFYKKNSELKRVVDLGKTISATGGSDLVSYPDADPLAQKSYVDAIAQGGGGSAQLEARVSQLEQDVKDADADIAALEGKWRN